MLTRVSISIAIIALFFAWPAAIWAALEEPTASYRLRALAFALVCLTALCIAVALAWGWL